MCGRFVQGLSLEEFKRQFAEYNTSDTLPAPSWNIAPTQQIAILLEDHKRVGMKRAESARWSLTPPWSETIHTPYPTFNARVEGLASKPTWQAPLKRRRCVVVTTGFFEWSGAKGQRVPHFIYGPEPTLLMAGLYGWWREPGATGDDGWHLTATILTRNATGIIERLHDRAPVFMHPELMGVWINPQHPGDQQLADVIADASLDIASQLRMHEVAPLRGDGPELIVSV